MNKTTRVLSRAGLIACLYIVLSLLMLPVSSGALQLRASELLTLLPLIYIEAIPALFIGCLLSNLLTGCALIDVFLGSAVTLFSASLTFLMGKLIKNKPLKLVLGGIFPVILNAFILPLIWLLCYGANEYVYIIQALLILSGQTIAVYGLGIPTYFTVDKLREKNINFLQ